MRFCTIASGSSGNCIYVGTEHTHILIDIGISKKRVEEGLETLGISPEKLTAIFITHEHADHIQGLGAFCRKYAVPIYASSGTLDGIRNYKALGKMDETLYHEISADVPVTMGDITIHPFHISHDANEPTAYRMEAGGAAFAVATDLGYYDEYIVEHLKGLQAIILEANHDVHMLEVGAYPYPLKQRILSNRGHLSNELSGRLLCEILHKDLKHIILGHLSKDNNYPELAYETVKLEVTLSSLPVSGEDLPLSIAKRDTLSEVFTI